MKLLVKLHFEYTSIGNLKIQSFIRHIFLRKKNENFSATNLFIGIINTRFMAM